MSQKIETTPNGGAANPASGDTLMDDPTSGDNEAGGQERGQWGSKLEFILTCVGYAVGLGNVWRFPYLCYRNGGGAFLIPYFLMLALVGIPIFFMELSFGQFASLGPIAIWSVNPLLKGLGYAMVVTNTIIGMYYNVIICWSIYFFFASMTDKLPWEDCSNWWNTEMCFTSDEYKELNLTEDDTNFTIPGTNLTYPREYLKTPSEEYFYNQVLRMSDGIDEMGGIVWQLALCLLISWTTVFFVLIKGISSLGKVVYFTSTFPYVMLTIMLIRGCTLEGAGTGIQYYLQPDWERLTDARVWSDAATQIFYSLSACTGGLIAMASFNQFSNNVYRDSILVPCINCGTSFYAGFVIFSVLGFMANEKGVSVDDVAASGPGLVFVVYPEALTQMPVAPLWAILFFAMLISLGFSSEFSMIECFFASISDEFPHIFRRSRAVNLTFRMLTIVFFFLITLPMVTEGGFYLFNLVDVYIGGFPLLFIGFFETIGLAAIYGYSKFAEDIAMMIGRKPPMFFKGMWIVGTPLILGFIIIFMCIQQEPLWLEDYEYPTWANGIGWLIVLAPMICIPIWFFYTYFADGGWRLLVESSKPTPEWGPALPEDRTGRYAVYDKEQEMAEVYGPTKKSESVAHLTRRISQADVYTGLSEGIKTPEVMYATVDPNRKSGISEVYVHPHTPAKSSVIHDDSPAPSYQSQPQAGSSRSSTPSATEAIISSPKVPDDSSLKGHTNPAFTDDDEPTDNKSEGGGTGGSDQEDDSRL